MDTATVAVVVVVAVIILLLYAKFGGTRRRHIKEFPRKYLSDNTKVYLFLSSLFTVSVISYNTVQEIIKQFFYLGFSNHMTCYK